ncbi:MAG: hypothetical protein IK149_09170 [Oscillospiraceae bacterium]|nr:hypothetical protein [Oscillospiraceae bacterium]
MSKLRKAAWTLLKIAVVILLLLGSLYLLSRPWYYRLGYFGARISGTVRVEMDGEVYDLRAEDFSTVKTGRWEGRLSVREKADGSARVAIRAVDYGSYGFYLKLDGLEQPIWISSYQYNWWNVTRFELLIRVDSAAGTICFESAAEDLDEDGRWRQEPHSETLDLSSDELVYCMVSV